MTLESENSSNLDSKSRYLHLNSEKDSNVTAVLGPTNTGKTYYAIERMLSYNSGVIGCPLRLLAREIYEKLIKIKGYTKVALITGEESIIPPMSCYYVCTVEAIPKNLNVEFAAIDEIQLSTHHERGHVFTDRLINFRGSCETLFLGSSSLSYLLKIMIPNINIKKMNRFSNLKYSGKYKISRIPRRSAIVTFSVNDVYEIAEFVKRRQGGTAVVLGALSPKTRNAQVDLYESGEVDHLVATDAIGMGLNMDIKHVAFAKLKKFDGKITRNLTFSETAQIAGRAGRYKTDGTFGETASCSLFNDKLVEAIENHNFPDITSLMWRNSDLDFSSISNLLATLVKSAQKPYLILSSESDDEKALRYLIKRKEIQHRSLDEISIKELWDVCCIPDYQKNYDDSHFSILEAIFCYLIDKGEVPEDWVNSHLEFLDNMSGELDLLGTRLSNVRMWNYISNRPGWISKNSGIKEKSKEIEDKLSDALHLGLVNRFVGYKTARMVKKLKDNDDLIAEIKKDEVYIEGHHVGRLENFNFINEVSKNIKDTDSIYKIIKKSLSKEIIRRIDKLESSSDYDFSFDKSFIIFWQSHPIAVLRKGISLYNPKIKILNTNYLGDKELDRIEKRILSFLKNYISNLNYPLLNKFKSFPKGSINGLIFQLKESSGCLLVAEVKNLLSDINEEERSQLNSLGIKIGKICIWIPELLSYQKTKLRWALSQIYHNINPLISFPNKNEPFLIKPVLPKQVLNSGNFILIKNYAYYVKFIEQFCSFIENIKGNKDAFFLSKRKIDIINKKFKISLDQIDCILKNLGYIKKNTKSNFYILIKIKEKNSLIENKKISKSPFRILYKKIL